MSAATRKGFRIKKITNMQLIELRKYEWWKAYENGPKGRPRTLIINRLKSLFPEWSDDPNFNFHMDKRKSPGKVKLYTWVPREAVSEDSNKRQSEISTVSDAVLRNDDLLG